MTHKTLVPTTVPSGIEQHLNSFTPIPPPLASEPIAHTPTPIPCLYIVNSPDLGQPDAELPPAPPQSSHPTDSLAWGSVEEAIEADAKERRARNPVRPHHRRTMREMTYHVVHAIAEHGIERAGFFTLTTDEPSTAEETLDSYSRFAKDLKKELGPEWVRVLDVNRDGKFHFHGVILFPEDIAEHFDWDVYRSMQRYNDCREPAHEKHEQQGTPGRVLTKNIYLKNVWRLLSNLASQHGFGPRVQVTPVRNPVAVSRYLAGRYCACLRTEIDCQRRARHIAYSAKFPKAAEVPPTPYQLQYRRDRTLLLYWASITEDDMKRWHGHGWNWLVITAIWEFDQRYGKGWRDLPREAAEGLHTKDWRDLQRDEIASLFRERAVRGDPNPLEDYLKIEPYILSCMRGLSMEKLQSTDWARFACEVSPAVEKIVHLIPERLNALVRIVLEDQQRARVQGSAQSEKKCGQLSAIELMEYLHTLADEEFCTEIDLSMFTLPSFAA